MSSKLLPCTNWSETISELKQQDRKTLEKLQQIKQTKFLRSKSYEGSSLQKREAMELNHQMEYLKNCDDLC